MGIVAKCGSTVILSVNSFFGIIGLVFLVGGALMKLKPDLLDKVSQQAMDQIAEQVPEGSGIDLQNMKLTDMIGDAATPCIVVGVVLLSLVFWAYCGMCCESRWMLIVYAAILTAVILGEVTFAIILTTKREKIDDAIKKPMKESLKKYYTGDKGKDILTLGWNALMGLLHCCGAEGSADFETTLSWNHSYTVKQGSVSNDYKFDAPILCCKTKTATCSQQNKIHDFNKGCYDAIWDLIKNQKSIAIGAACAVGVIEIAMWIFVVAIIRELGQKNNKVKPE